MSISISILCDPLLFKADSLLFAVIRGRAAKKFSRPIKEAAKCGLLRAKRAEDMVISYFMMLPGSRGPRTNCAMSLGGPDFRHYYCHRRNLVLVNLVWLNKRGNLVKCHFKYVYMVQKTRLFKDIIQTYYLSPLYACW